ncbi:HigA family addiction module antitoxin [Turicibacter sanguinis]|uniref:HigA family addiction module antitoxin n=1 Tax=Turicibacter sanguinis TaxID=154288 RepID=UPI002942C30E|nr:HigA family addiction module antitoxin [Turicibacter sanguinis]
MASKNVSNNFLAAIAIPPGETIHEYMDYLGMNQQELAVRLEVSVKHLNNILNGKSPITYETALKLETVIGPSAEFWMNLESQYQLNKARLEKEAEMLDDKIIVQQFPYKKMSDYGWVEAVTDRIERVINLRKFFGVATLSAIKPSYQVQYRKQKAISQIDDYSVLAWLRQATLAGNELNVKEFNKTKLKALIPTFRQLTNSSPETFFPEIQKLCSECGVALVLVEDLPKTYICGATIWSNNYAILALSVRGKKADKFWFTFFHELAHLIHHSKNSAHVHYQGNNDEEEAEADLIASNYLIPNVQYNKFISNKFNIDKSDIIEFAKEVEIHPCIVLGRLKHDRIVDFSRYNELVPSFVIVRNKKR